MGPENKSNRIYLFDNLKFFLIATVVVGHFADEAYGKSGFFKMIFMFIYAFHMPLFLFCSGLFHSNKDVFIKAFKYIGVGYAAKIVMSLSRLMLSGRMSFRLLEDTELPWYMFVMAIYIVATYLLRNVDKRYLLAFAVVTALFAGYDNAPSTLLAKVAHIEGFSVNPFTMQNEQTFVLFNYNERDINDKCIGRIIKI